MVAHACNPSCSGGRDQEDHRSKPEQIVCKTLSRKNPSQKTVGGVAQGVGPEFKPQYCKKERKRRKEGGREGRKEGKEKRWQSGSSSKSDCLVSVRP
jgi:hypothetical protein